MTRENMKKGGEKKSRSCHTNFVETLENRLLFTELLQNQSFTNGLNAWSRTGDFWVGAIQGQGRTDPGYAAGGVNTSGTGINPSSGSLSQTVTIPANTSSLRFNIWHQISTSETTTSNAYDQFDVYLLANGVSSKLLSITNLDKSTGYIQKQIIISDASAFAGKSATLNLVATTDSSKTTTFRIDDLHLDATVSTMRPPTIDSITGTPNPITAGSMLALKANGVNDDDGDDTVSKVTFYRESNGVFGLQEVGSNSDASVGSDTSSPHITSVSTSGLSPGTYTYYAVAVDASGLKSNVVSTTNTVSAPTTANPPSITKVSPNPIPASSSIQTLTINGAYFQSGTTLTFTTPSGSVIQSTAAKLTRVNSGQLAYQLSNANDVGTWSVKVNNPDGKSSNVVTFAVGSYSPPLKYIIGDAFRLKPGGGTLKYQWTISRRDKLVIDPSKPAILVTHGYYSNAEAMSLLAEKIDDQTSVQVLTLDWAAGSIEIAPNIGYVESGIEGLGAVVAAHLIGLGFKSEQLDLVGHSFGSYVSYEIAEAYLAAGRSKVNSILAIDPASDVPALLVHGGVYNSDLVNFADVSQYSWAFLADVLLPANLGMFGNATSAATARESFVVENSGHTALPDFYANLLANNSKTANLFDYSKLMSGASGPWDIDKFNAEEGTFINLKYEALLWAASNNKTSPVSVDYFVKSKRDTYLFTNDPMTASISGVAFNDTNKNGKYDAGDSLAGGKVIWLDLDDDNVLDNNEPKVTTDASGYYIFNKLAARTYHVRRGFPRGFVESTPPRYVTLTVGQKVSGVLIGSKIK